MSVQYLRARSTSGAYAGIPLVGASPGVPFARAATHATPDVVYSPPVTPAPPAVISAVGGVSAEVGVQLPANHGFDPATQRFRIFGRLTLGYQLVRFGAGPDFQAGALMSLQSSNAAGVWVPMNDDPPNPTGVNGITRISGSEAAGAAYPGDDMAGMSLAGDAIITGFDPTRVLALRAIWQQQIDTNYLQPQSFTQSEGERGGWHLEMWLALEDPLAP